MPEKNPVAAAPPPAKGVSFGERMRRERELRGVKLEEIAESTKIGKRNLVALEEEAFDQLPGGIFNKGFVRAYAKFLGLDEEQAVNDFLAASTSTDQPTLQLQTALLKPAVMPSDEALRKKDLRWAIAALMVLVVALGVWLYASRGGFHRSRADSDQLQSAQPKPQAATQTLSAATPAPANAPLSASAQSTPNVQETPAAQGTGTPPAAQGPKPRGADQKPATAPSESQPASAAGAAGTVSPLILSLHATGDSWVSVTGDGTPMGEFQMRAGESRRFQAEKSLTLKAGNAGAIELSLNGKPQPKLGKDKEVKTATFTAP